MNLSSPLTVLFCYMEQSTANSKKKITIGYTNRLCGPPVVEVDRPGKHSPE